MLLEKFLHWLLQHLDCNKEFFLHIGRKGDHVDVLASIGQARLEAWKAKLDEPNLEITGIHCPVHGCSQSSSIEWSGDEGDDRTALC